VGRTGLLDWRALKRQAPVSSGNTPRRMRLHDRDIACTGEAHAQPCGNGAGPIGTASSPNKGEFSMPTRSLAVAALAALSFAAHATDYTDIWWNPAESGWGVNLAQSNTFIFATFFVYGPGNAPTWYAGNLTLDASGAFVGPLYATTGTYLGTAPFNPVQSTATQVGTASFKPRAADTGVLTYNVGGVTVNKNIERQTLTPVSIGGTYAGGVAVLDSDCADATDNGPADGPATITVTQTPGGTTQVMFDILGFATCIATSTGTVTLRGPLYSFPVSFDCGSGPYVATVSELRATSLGIEGRWQSADASAGCREEGRFSGVVKY